MWASSAYMLLPILLPCIIVGGADAACCGPGQRMDPQKAADVGKDPAQFAQSLAGNNAELIGATRALAASDPSTLLAIIGLLQVFNSSGTSNTALGLFQGRPREPAVLRQPPPLPPQRIAMLQRQPVCESLTLD